MTQQICGTLRFDGAAPDPGLLTGMVQAMIGEDVPHRVETATRGPAAMAATRLTPRGADEPPARPNICAMGERLIVADATIYAGGRGPPAEQLEASLDAPGAGLGAIVGDFAVARWTDGRLTLARDHFGARPLVYTVKPGAYLAFASSPRALLAAGLAPADLDEAVVASWPLHEAPPSGRSAYAAIRRLEPAHILTAEDGKIQLDRFWRLNVARRLPLDSDPRELAAETRRLLEQAVRRRLPPAGPCAADLSGGLDSSPLAAIAARQGRGVFAYTFCDEAGEGDGPLADIVAAAEPGISQVRIASPGLWEGWRHGVEQGTLLPLAPDHPEEQRLRHAAGQGVGTILSGWGGDQIVSYQGRGAELEVARAGSLGKLWHALAAESRATGVAPLRLFAATVLMQALPQRTREKLRRRLHRQNPLDEAIAERLSLIAAHRRDGLLFEPLPDSGDSHSNRRDAAEAWSPQARLDALAWHGARHGVRFAYPLLDLDLVEFSICVPGIFSRQAGHRRMLYRRALEGLLPEPVRLNPIKTQPFPREAQRVAGRRGALLSLLARWSENGLIRDFLDVEQMRRVVEAAGDAAAPPHLADCDLGPAFQIGALLAGHGSQMDASR